MQEERDREWARDVGRLWQIQGDPGRSAPCSLLAKCPRVRFLNLTFRHQVGGILPASNSGRVWSLVHTYTMACCSTFMCTCSQRCKYCTDLKHLDTFNMDACLKQLAPPWHHLWFFASSRQLGIWQAFIWGRRMNPVSQDPAPKRGAVPYQKTKVAARP